MKSITVVIMCAAAVLAACSINSSAPPTAWGKVGVSMLDYRTDGGQCAVLAATANGKDNSTAIHGENGKVPPNVPQGSAQAGSAAASGGAVGGGQGASSSATTNSGSMYRDNASPDFVNRAAEQQRTQEMAAQRYRNDMLKSCLAGRGYTEFELTPQQRSELAQLPQGSDERRAYLYKLGTDPEVLKKQSVAPQK